MLPSALHAERRGTVATGIRKDGSLARARIAAAVIGILAVVTGAGALADTHERRRADLTELPIEALLQIEVLGASKFPQRITEAPSAVSLVTREDIQTFGYRTLGEALASVRGVYTTNDRNYRYLGIRGFARPGDYNTRALLLVDGYRINDNIYDYAPIGLEFPLDISLVERIEFVPGPSSSLYGSSAFFGVVNVVTRRAKDISSELSWYRESFRADGLRVNLGRRLDSGLELTLSASAHASDGPNPRFEEFAAINDGVASGLDFEHATKIYGRASRGAWTLSFGASERRKGIPTASYSTAFNQPGSETTDAYQFADLRYYAPRGERADLLLRVQYADYRYRGRYAYDVPPIVINHDEARGTFWGGEAQLLYRWTELHKLVAGLELRRNSRQEQRNFDVEPAAVYLDDLRRSHQLGLYVEDEYRFRPDLILNAGIRRDERSGFGGSTSPRLALIHLPTEGSAVKLLYGRAFRAPNAYERYYAVPGPGGQKTNPELSPEHIYTWEAVYERSSATARFAGSLYYYRIEHLISLTVDPADGLPVFRNIDRVHTRGAEIEAERHFAGGVRVRGSLALQSAVSGGNWLDNSPRRLAKLFVSAPLFGERLRLGFEAHHIGDRTGRAGGVGGYTVANLALTGRVAPGLELSAGIYNLGGKKYFDIGAPDHVQDRLPQDGRTARVQLTARY